MTNPTQILCINAFLEKRIPNGTHGKNRNETLSADAGKRLSKPCKVSDGETRWNGAEHRENEVSASIISPAVSACNSTGCNENTLDNSMPPVRTNNAKFARQGHEPTAVNVL